MVPVRDWVAWHRDYDDPGSPLSNRLERVSWHLCRALDRAPSGPVRLVSLCAGQGRDVLRAGMLRRQNCRYRVASLMREHQRGGRATRRRSPASSRP
jgi:hypothetical protein